MIETPANEVNEREAIQNRVIALKSELSNLEWKLRPSVPHYAKVLASQNVRGVEISRIMEAECANVRVEIGAWKEGYAQQIDRCESSVGFEFTRPSVFLSISASLPFEEAKKCLTQAVAHLEFKASELYEEAGRKESDFGREFEDIVKDEVVEI